jgi:uncharacterized protein (TIGR00730 family)
MVPAILPNGRNSREDLMITPQENLEAILASPSYVLAEEDAALLKRDELRPVRLQLELFKPELVLHQHHIRSTIVVFGGTRIVEPAEAERRLAARREAAARAPGDPDLARRVGIAERILAKAHYYEASREFGRLVSSRCQLAAHREFVVVTGGGPGIMEAANRGAHEAGAKSIGFNITLPHEQVPNAYITPDLCFRFHYFALRKMHFLMRARGLVAFPGGFGTMDELFEALTLMQTRKIAPVPVVLFGRDYWQAVVRWEEFVEEGTVDPADLDLFHYAETPEEAWRIICDFHGLDPAAPRFG